jgi:hypothetical protein
MEERPSQKTESQSEPEVLYHYTTQEGLLGILKDKCIWATHIRYLNDTSEGNIVSRLVFEEFVSRYSADPILQSLGISAGAPKKEADPVDQEALNQTLNQGTMIASWATSQNVFVASFSEKGNSLSQWRAYSGKSGGYSIGFRPDYLRTVGESFLNIRTDRFYSDSSILVPCVYFSEKAEKSLRDEISNQVSAFIKEVATVAKEPVVEGTQGFKTPGAIALKHFIKYGKQAAITKDEGFREEAEWRLALILQQNSTVADLEFRTGNSMPVPFLRVPLQLPDQVIGIWRVIVGPCPHPDEAVKSVKMLFESHGFRGVEVVPSGIPFRNW